MYEHRCFACKDDPLQELLGYPQYCLGYLHFGRAATQRRSLDICHCKRCFYVSTALHFLKLCFMSTMLHTLCLQRCLLKCFCDQSWQVTTQQCICPALTPSPWGSILPQDRDFVSLHLAKFLAAVLTFHLQLTEPIWPVRQLAHVVHNCHVVQVAALAQILTRSCYCATHLLIASPGAGGSSEHYRVH